MITMIAAITPTGVIGERGPAPLLWKSEFDMEFFRKQTENQTVVMGKNTFQSLGSKPLKNRKNIVLTNTEEPGHRDGVFYYNNMSDIFANYSSFTVIGGESLYNLFIDIADEVLLTTVSMEVPDTEDPAYAHFPIAKLEKQFAIVGESDVVPDTDKFSGSPISLIFTRWSRGVDTIH